jgi:hypothetical protein
MRGENAMSDEASSGQETSKPFGPVAAVFLAAGIGSLVLGLLTTIAEANATFADKLNWYNPVGPLSGKTLIAVIVFAASWGFLHLALRRKEPAQRLIYFLTGLLVVGGFLFTFPKFFDLFASK